MNEAERVIEVVEAIVEDRVSFLDEVMERVFRLLVVEADGIFMVILRDALPHLLHERLEPAELLKQRLVRQVGNVLHMVIRLVLVLVRLLLRIPRVNALQDAQPAEVAQRDLQRL